MPYLILDPPATPHPPPSSGPARRHVEFSRDRLDEVRNALKGGTLLYFGEQEIDPRLGWYVADHPHDDTLDDVDDDDNGVDWYTT